MPLPDYLKSPVENNVLTLQPAETQPNGIFFAVKGAYAQIIGIRRKIYRLLYKSIRFKGECARLIFIADCAQRPAIETNFYSTGISRSENQNLSRFDLLVLVSAKHALHNGFSIGNNRNP